MKSPVFTLFETSQGTCGIAWNERGVTGFQLPEASRKQVASRIAVKSSAKRARIIPSQVAVIIERVKSHFKGETQDFQDIVVDLDGAGPFAKEIYAAARKIPSGRTMTYGELANTAGRPGASRAVGQAMGKNPVPIIIPCHRILAAGNRPGGFSAHGGIATKAKLLELEGAAMGPPAVITSMQDLKQAASRLGKKDPRLARLLSQPIEFRLRPEHSPYETLVEAVVHQQLSPKAAATILGRIIALYPASKLPPPAELLKTPDERLRSAGLSRSKTKAVKDIAAKTLDGTVPSSREIRSLGNEEIIKRLTSIYGVGQWTVEMMLIFNLGRIDVWPVDDYALRTSIAEVFRMKRVFTPKQAAFLGEAWRPYRTVAALYFWDRMKP